MFDLTFGISDFNTTKSSEIQNQYMDYMILIILLYLPICEACKYLSKYVNKKFISWITTFWNLFLSIFSGFGAFVCIRFIYYLFTNYSFHDVLSVTYTETDYRINNLVSIWIFMFTLSKIPEFLDTWLYCLKNGRDHIFLHWWHHQVTAIYGIISIHNQTKYGIILAGMNYFVHTIMYFYYFIQELNNPFLKKVFKIVAPFITFIQTLQMIISLFVYYYTYMFVDGKLDVFGFAMYSVYFIYFSKLFVDKYLIKKNKTD